MSSARMPPRPSSPRKDSQDSPRCWYGRSSPEKPAGVGIGRSRWSAWPDSRSPSQPSASTPTSGISSSGRPGPSESQAHPGRQRVRRGHRPGLVALQELQRRLQVRVVQLDPLAAQPDQRDLQPGQLGQLVRDRAPGRLLPRRTGSPPGRPGRTWPRPPRRRRAGRGARLAWSASARAVALRTQSGSSTPNPAPASSGPVSLRNRNAPGVSISSSAGAASRSASSSSAKSRAAAPRPASSSSTGIAAGGEPGPAPAQTSAAEIIRLGSSADCSANSTRQGSASGVAGSASRKQVRTGPGRDHGAVPPRVELGGQRGRFRLVLRRHHVDAGIGRGQGHHVPFGQRQAGRDAAAPRGQQRGGQPGPRGRVGQGIQGAAEQRARGLPGGGPAGRGHGRGQVTGALRVGTAEHRPPPRRISVALGLEHGQHPAAGGQAGREPRHRGQVGQRPAGHGGVAGRAGADPSGFTQQRQRGARGRRRARAPASPPATPGRAGPVPEQPEPPEPPTLLAHRERPAPPGGRAPARPAGRRRPTAAAGSARRGRPCGPRRPPPCWPTRRPGQQVGQLGGLAGERMRPGQVHARRRGRGPRRQVRVLGPQAERAVVWSPCAQTPWITRMTCSVLPIAPSPTLTSG